VLGRPSRTARPDYAATMSSMGDDPLDAGSRELRVFRGYGAARRFALRITADLVPATWPAPVRLALLVPAHVMAVVLTAMLWAGVTVALAFSLLSRSPSGR
jgi:hypothetical protein